MDPSETVCIEYLHPKTIPEQLIAQSTVLQIAETQLKLQITGGIICLVDQFNISQAYSNLLRNYSDAPEANPEPPKLSDLFKRGQQLVCKLLERRPRKGYTDAVDLLGTLDPTELQEDNIPSTVLAIPQVPLQCAIESIEDHGYKCDIGFKNLTGFLSFEEAEQYCKKHCGCNKLLVGQIIRCCTRELYSDANGTRVVQLSLSKVHLKRSEFSKEKVANNLLTERCILPGSIGYLTVMKVKTNGLIVNFLDEFAGFVCINHLKEEWHIPRENYKVSDQFKCSVLYYNNVTKCFALSLKSKLRVKKSVKHFVQNYHVGQVLKDVEVKYIDGTKAVHFRIDSNYRAVAHVKDALNVDTGTMTKDEIHLALDSAYPDQSKHKCRVKSVNLADLVVVVSLKQDFLDLPYISIEELKPGDFIDATIKKHVKDGVVVSFGLNLRAIILNVHLEDYLTSKSYKKYPVGKLIKCRVLKVDHDNYPGKVYLTNKEKLMDPEMTIVDCYDKTFRGQNINATIVKVKNDGVIVELFNNVKGFIPRRFLSSVKLSNLGGLFEIGLVISCVIYRVEPARQCMMLGTIPIKQILQAKKEKKKAKKEKTTKRKLDQVENNEAELSTVKKDKKSRLQRSLEAKMREEKIRDAEKALLDPDRPPQSIGDFERLILKDPNSASPWIKYSKFFLDNVETEKARVVCRRALKTINFRMVKEKTLIWLQLIRIEAMYGGLEQLRATIEEAAQVNDRLALYSSTCKVLVHNNLKDEADRLYQMMIKIDHALPESWIEYILFLVENKEDLDGARKIYEKALKCLTTKNQIYLKSRFAQFEFKYGEVERGKTLFESLLSEHPKRKDIWKVYEAFIKKFGTRQMDNEEVREQNEQILQRIASLTN